LSPAGSHPQSDAGVGEAPEDAERDGGGDAVGDVAGVVNADGAGDAADGAGDTADGAGDAADGAGDGVGEGSCDGIDSRV
jgi:hypothetical protein